MCRGSRERRGQMSKTNKRFMEVTLDCGCALDVEETVDEWHPMLEIGDPMTCEKHGGQAVKHLETLCGCGELLHYTDPVMQAYITGLSNDLGEYVKITVPDQGAWLVQRHFIA